MPHLRTPSGLNWHFTVEGPSTGGSTSAHRPEQKSKDSGQAEGPELLFLHGWAVNSRIWHQQVKYFSERYRVMSVDLPGHGKSGWQKISLNEIAQDVEFLLNEQNFGAVGIVASSFGGLVGLKIHEMNPDRVKFFVFAGSQPKFSRSEDHPSGLEVERIRKLAGQLESDYPAIVNIFFRSLFTRDERESRRFKWIQTFRKTEEIADKQALLNLLGILEKEDLREVFRNVDRPMCFLNGTEDHICSRGFYENLQAELPSARFEWFEKCGHFPFLTRPHEFNRELEKFLGEVMHDVGPVQLRRK